MFAAKNTSVHVTIPLSPVVTEDALYASVLNRISAFEGTGLASFHNLILNQANQQGPTLTPVQYTSLVTLAAQYRSELATDLNLYKTTIGNLRGASPKSVPSAQAALQTVAMNQQARTLHYLALVQTQTGLGNVGAPTAFDTFAWNNYAPSYVECGSGGDPGEIYGDLFLQEEPGTGELFTWADAWLGAGFVGDEGADLSLTLNLYDSSGIYSDVALTGEGQGGGSASAFTSLQPAHLGDLYTSDALATAASYNEDSGPQESAEGMLTIQAVGCSPTVTSSGILVDGVPTNGFGLGKSGTMTVTGQCLDGVSSITTPLSGLTFSNIGSATQVAGSQTPGLETLTASYQVSSSAQVGMSYMQVSTSDGRTGLYSPISVTPSLPYITSVLPPGPWTAGTTVPYTIYGAGFGVNATVSITLASGLTAVVTPSCGLGQCSDSILEGTVTLPAESGPDAATIPVGYSGYGSPFQAQQPPPGSSSASVPINALWPQFKVTSVQFTNSYLLAADNGYTSPPPVIDTTVWRSSCSAPPCMNPSAFAQGTRITASVTFSVANVYSPLLFTNVRIEGSVPGLGTLVASSYTIPPGQGAFSVPVVADTPLPSGTQLLNPMTINWNIVLYDYNNLPCGHVTNCQAVGSSSSTVYVTMATPPATILPLPLTTLGLAVGNGGASGPNAAKLAFQNTWAMFSQNGSGPANVKAYNGIRLLSYYPSGFGFQPCATNSNLLLNVDNGNGACGSFAHLLQDALAVNGISMAYVTIMSLNGDLFMVKNWQFNGNDPTYSPYDWPVTLQFECANPPACTSFYAGMVPLPAGSLFGQAMSGMGIPGQNTTTPSEKIFSNHQILLDAAGVSGAGPYYDPSYGVTYLNACDSTLGFEAKAVDGYLKQILGVDSGTNYHARKPDSATCNIYFSTSH